MFFFVSCSIVTIFVESTLANHLLVRVQLKNSVTGLRPADSKEPELFLVALKRGCSISSCKISGYLLCHVAHGGFPSKCFWCALSRPHLEPSVMAEGPLISQWWTSTDMLQISVMF